MARAAQGAIQLERKKLHYAWMICLGCVLLMFCITGLSINVITIYIPYFIGQNGLTNAQGSSMTLVRSCFSLVCMMLARQYYKRINLKTGMVAACFINVFSFICFSVAHSLPMFYIGSAFIGISHGFGTMIPISILIDRWFEDRRAFALSLCASGSGLATIVAPPILEAVINRYGVVSSLIVEAVFVTAVVVFLAFVLDGNPQDKGVSAYKVHGGGSSERRTRSFEAKHLSLGKGERLVMVCALLLFGAVVTAGTGHLAVHFSTAGFDAKWVTFSISLFGFALTFGQYVYGSLTDRFGTYRSNLIFLGFQVAGWLLIGLAQHGSVVCLVLGVGLAGIGLPTSTVGVSLWAADFSKASDYEIEVERYQGLSMAGGLLGSVLPGIIADLTGSYGPAYVLFALFMFTVMVLLQGLYRRHGVTNENS